MAAQQIDMVDHITRFRVTGESETGVKLVEIDWSSGSKYKGEVGFRSATAGAATEGEPSENDYFANGYGILEFNDGSRYEGQWKHWERHGQGIQIYTNGTRYEGKWENDRRSLGTLTYENGNTYKGQFGHPCEYDKIQEGKSYPENYSPQNGYGIYTTPKKIMEGFWKNDHAQGYFIATNRLNGKKKSHFYRNGNRINERGIPLLERYADGCSICLEDFNEMNGQVIATSCLHYFHEKCLGNITNCPLCRKEVLVKTRIAALHRYEDV